MKNDLMKLGCHLAAFAWLAVAGCGTSASTPDGGAPDSATSNDAAGGSEAMKRCMIIGDSVRAAGFDDKVKVTCDQKYAWLEGDTYPAHEKMTDITGTNDQVPLPAPGYRSPIVLAPSKATKYTTIDAALGVAVNGVPVYDYTSQGMLDPAVYDPRADTKVTGELDLCNGHAGRGDDYHYHAAPVCMIAAMKNRGFATTKGNIDIGWVLGQRVVRLSLDGSEDDYDSLTLDPQGEAVGDAHGTAISGDGKHLAIACGGSHEVVLFRNDGPLPWRAGGSRDLLPVELIRDGRFRRVPLGGRPTEIVFGPDAKTLYVANYLGDSVQVVDTDSAKLVATVRLGSPKEVSIVRRGEAIFHDAQRSFNQWYSCNTCHSDGHTNGLDYDTLNDGWQDLSTTHQRSRKKAPTLREVTKTGPWTWHGWQTSFDDAMLESFTKSMQGPRPSPEDVKAITAYLGTLEYPRNPNRAADGSISEAAQRGRDVYRSPKAMCQTCHGGPDLTDGKIHDVGLNERGDVYRGHNPPSLRGVYDKAPYLHDGRAKDLRETLTKHHDPDQLNGAGELTSQELDDLIAYLMTL